MRKQPTLLVLAMMLFVAYGMAQMQPGSGPNSQSMPGQGMPGQQDPTMHPQTGYPGDTAGRDTTDSTQASDRAKVSDPELQSAVQSKLSGDPAFSGVQSNVENGKVELTGTVSSKDEKKRLKKEITSIAGVRGIKNDVQVNENKGSANSSQGSTGSADANSQNTAGSIAGNSQSSTREATSPGAPSAGTADSSQTGSMSAQNSAQAGSNMPQSDTTAQSNGAQASSSAAGSADDSAQLQQQIDRGIKTDPSLAQSSIAVSVNDTSVNLSGTVMSDAAKKNAERIAQSYAANRKVNNNIEVMGAGTGSMNQGQPSMNESGTTTSTPDTNSSPTENPPVNQQPQAGSTR